jgi:hypothetical protein
MKALATCRDLGKPINVDPSVNIVHQPVPAQIYKKASLFKTEFHTAQEI